MTRMRHSVSSVNATYSENYTVTKDNVQNSSQTSLLDEDIVIMVVYSTFCLLGIIGNGLVIWFGIFKMKKTVNVVWYLSLAVVDSSFAFFFLLNTMRIFITHRLFMETMCRVTNFFLYINMVVSILQVTVISVDRCVCVVFPVWCHNHRRPRLAFIIVLVIWVMSLFVAVPYTITNVETTDINNRTLCVSKVDESTEMRIRILEFVFFFFLPFLTIVSCYIVIVLHLRRKRIFESSRPLKTTVAVITAFFICWFPNHLFFLLSSVDSSMFGFYVNYYGSVTVVLLMVLNSCINPVIYVFIGQDFKEKFCGSFQAKFEKAFIEDD